MEEIWRDVPGYDGKYQASNLGRIKSIGVVGKRGYDKNDRFLALYSNGLGYQLVGLSKGKKQHKYLVHRIVWITFNGQIPEGKEINHKNEDRSDNRLSNLELLSHKDNINFGNRTSKYEKCVLQSSLDGAIIKTYESITKAHKDTGVCISNISRCCIGLQKTAGGYCWRYA